MANALDIIIRAKNLASKELKKVTANLKEMDNATKMALGGITSFAGGFAAMQAGRFAVEMAQLSTELERSAFAFDHFSGGADEAAANMRAVQRASGGMLTSFDAQNLAVTAMTQGLASTSQELERVTKVARGIVAVSPVINDMETAFSQLALTIANQSTMRLDQLGTSVGELQPKIEELKAANKDLTDQMAFQIALMDTLEGKYDPLLEAAVNQATGLERLTTALRDNRAALAGNFAWINTISGAFADLVERAGDVAAAMELVTNPPADASAEQMAVLDAIEAQMDLANQRKISQVEAEKNIEALLQSYYRLRDAAVQAGQAEEAAAKAAATEMELAYRTQQQKMAEYNQQIEQAGVRAFQSVFESTGSAQLGMAAYEQTVNKVRDAMRDLPETFHSAEKMLMVLPVVVSRVSQEIGEMFTFGAKAAESVIDPVEKLGAAMQGLEGFVGGASGAMRGFVRDSAVAQSAAINFAGAIASAYETVAKVYEGPLGLNTGQKGKIRAPGLDEGDGMKAIALEAGFAASAVSRVNQEFEDLKSTISGIVTGAIGPVAGVDANDLLPRPDAVNENARRLADIAVNGIKGQDWLAEFAAEVPGVWDEIANSGDPQGTAARILKDFQDGLRPELLDKERAKDLVRRALQGDANTKALIDEIAGELAGEFNISLSQAKEAAAGVLGGGTDAGTTGVSLSPKIDTGAAASAAVSFSSAFVGAIESGSLGADLGAALMVQVAGSVALVEQTGKDAGNVFVTGFTGAFDAIPTAFIAAVVSLAMPSIMANMSSNGGRTGAADV